MIGPNRLKAIRLQQVSVLNDVLLALIRHLETHQSIFRNCNMQLSRKFVLPEVTANAYLIASTQLT